jgi:hypothetical protein
VDVFLQSLLLAGIGICVWLAFHPSSREDYDDFEAPRRFEPPVPAPRSGQLDTGFVTPPVRRRMPGEGYLPAQSKPVHDASVEAAARPAEVDPSGPQYRS